MQILQGKVVSCHLEEPHQIATGAPLNPDHTELCKVKAVSDILLPSLTSPEHSLRTYLCWSCTVCQGTYRGTTSTCPKEDCKGKAGTGYFPLAKRFT